ncbi:MAG: hypothetical protein V2I97_10500 [Desulfococcaceae bacterium]|jgi:hypothetical protein|nr:hypothetical protein [Desulfococcaceae bacterium]
MKNSVINSKSFPLLFQHVIIFVLIFLLPTGRSYALTESELQDALLKDTPYTNDLDLNADGVLDVSDLVQMDKSLGPVVNFAELSSNFQEGDGTAAVAVALSGDFSGMLRYSIDNADYSVSVDGNTVNISVPIADNDVMAEDQVKSIRLEADTQNPPRYRLGSALQHILWIGENDSRWSGQLQTGLLSAGFVLDIKRSGSNWSGSLHSDGFGSIPAGDYAVDFQVTDTKFTAVIGPITVNAADTQFNEGFERTIILESEPSPDSPHSFDPDLFISGNMTDTFTSEKYPSRTVTGSFTLLKGLPDVPVIESELTAAMQ